MIQENVVLAIIRLGFKQNAYSVVEQKFFALRDSRVGLVQVSYTGVQRLWGFFWGFCIELGCVILFVLKLEVSLVDIYSVRDKARGQEMLVLWLFLFYLQLRLLFSMLVFFFIMFVFFYRIWFCLGFYYSLDIRSWVGSWSERQGIFISFVTVDRWVSIFLSFLRRIIFNVYSQFFKKSGKYLICLSLVKVQVVDIGYSFYVGIGVYGLV